MTQPVPGVHENFAGEAAMSADKAMVTDCDCMKVAQDETCPVGYPSLLCDVCDGKGVLPAALAHPPSKREAGEIPAPVQHVAGSDREDAERFRALMRCGRIKMQGSAGVDPQTGERNGNNVHFGAEFWPEPIPAGFEEYYEASTKWGRFCIKALADAILEQEARDTPPPQANVGREADGDYAGVDWSDTRPLPEDREWNGPKDEDE